MEPNSSVASAQRQARAFAGRALRRARSTLFPARGASQSGGDPDDFTDEAERLERHLRGRVPPPECPADWQTGPPDFVGVGVQKAGTTWWHRLLLMHPAIHGSVRKELHFFQHDWYKPFDGEQIAAYRRYFPRPEGAIVGEFTPRYMLDALTPRRLYQAAPDARLIVILRDPVERFRSGVTYGATRFTTQFENLHPRAVGLAFERGRYHAQLNRLLAQFPREQLLVLQFERCVADPAREIARTYRFLGVDPGFAAGEMNTPVNAASQEHLELPAELIDLLTECYHDDVAKIAAEFPEVDLDLWPNFRP